MDTFKDLEVERLSPIIQWVLNAITSVPIRRKQRFETEEEKPSVCGCRAWSDAATS